MRKTIGSFELDVATSGIATIIFSRPPVNAVSLAVYEDIGRLTDEIEASSDIRVVVFTAPDGARAWCGGADLNDFVGMNSERRKERYHFINAQIPRFYRIDRPVIAAINGAAIGVGMVLAGLCDMRVASEDATFACPEIDYGLVGGGAGLFAMLKMPEAKIRELLFTGRKFTARELEPTGLFNYVVPRAEVLPKAYGDRAIDSSEKPALNPRPQSRLSVARRPELAGCLSECASAVRRTRIRRRQR